MFDYGKYFKGLFVVVVNPYKRYPLYTHRVCKIYLGMLEEIFGKSRKLF